MPKSKRTKLLFMAGLIAIVAAVSCSLLQSEGAGGGTKSPGRSVILSDPGIAPSDAVFLFWYGCPHCRAVEDVFSREGADAQFHKVLAKGERLEIIPVPINQVWELHARLFFALSHANVSRSTHLLIMKTIQDEGLTSSASMRRAVSVAIVSEAKQGRTIGVSEDAILSDLYSSRTNNQIASAKSLSSQIGLKGVPALLLKKNTLLELGNGVTYTSLLPDALRVLNRSGSHD